MKVLVTQSCPTLCDSMNCIPVDSTVHVILQARTLEWVAIPFSRGSSRPRDQTHVSCIAREILYHLSHQGRPNNEGHPIENKHLFPRLFHLSFQHNPKAPLSPRNIQQRGPQQDAGLNTHLFPFRFNPKRDQ